MKLFLSHLGLCYVLTRACLAGGEPAHNNAADVLPAVLPVNTTDLIELRARAEAARSFGTHRLPDSLKEWELIRSDLRALIAQKTGAVLKQDLPLDMRETRVSKQDGYTVKNIAFQTRPGIYATANLYIPDGHGPFPAAVVMAGHSRVGRLGYSYLGYTLALNGFVAITIDPWGAGERTTLHGGYEYHGANLGASLMNVGESLMGLQITDNMRAVDLLCSLPFVDAAKIGATGASGGGNQTMWLAAMDERVKAAVPVVSVGTFESYVMGHNCICEVLIDGLTVTEESGVLAMVAPRALLLSNGLKDSNPAFYPSEMARSYTNALPIYALYGAADSFSHFIFDGPHSYPPETVEAMVAWFNRHLKGESQGQAGITMPARDLHAIEDLMVYAKGERDPQVLATADFCRKRGRELRAGYLEIAAFDVERKRQELKDILRIADLPAPVKSHRRTSATGWETVILETSDGKIIPLALREPKQGGTAYVILSTPDGARALPKAMIEKHQAAGAGIALVDLSGTGEMTSSRSAANDRLAKLHTLARANLWLGKTVQGEWVKELHVVTRFLAAEQNAGEICVEGSREAGLAGLFLAALGGNVGSAVLRDAPVSYLFDDRDTVDFFSMGIHLPGFLKWGDISLATALSGKEVRFIRPVTMSGRALTAGDAKPYRAEFERVRNACGAAAAVEFEFN